MKLAKIQGEQMLLVLILFLLIGIRWKGVLIAREGVIFNVDEMLMSLSAIDRFLGIPPRLSWPGTPLHLLAVPALLTKFVFQSMPNLNMERFAVFISELYRSPWEAVMIFRMSVVALSSIGFAMLVESLRDISENLFIRSISVLLIATAPLVWMYSHMVLSDSFALSFAMISLFFIAKAEAKIAERCILAGAIFGFAIASKVTIIIAFPFMVSILLIHSSSKLQDSLTFVIATIAGFAFSCPYVWTDPLRLAKGILGNASKPGDPAGLFGALEIMMEVFTLPLMAISLLGICRILAQKRVFMSSGILSSVGLALLIFSRAGMIYERYCLVIVIPLVYCVTSGLQLLSNLTGRLFMSNQKAAIGMQSFSLLAISVMIISLNINTYWQIFRLHKDSDAATWAMVDQIGTMQCKLPIAVPIELISYVSAHASSSSLTQMSKDFTAVSPLETVGDFAKGRGISATFLSVFGEAFNEEEKAFVSRIRAMTVSNPKGTQYDVIAWAASEKARRFQITDENKVGALLRSRELCAAIVNNTSPALMAYPGKYYGGYKLIK